MIVDILRFNESNLGCPGILIIDGELLCLTLEPDSNDLKRFQIPEGIYDCVRVKSHKFGDTFEIVVKGHTLIRFHWGNKEEDTTACILLGMTKGHHTIWNSKTAFALFMKHMEGIDKFKLGISKFHYK